MMQREIDDFRNPLNPYTFSRVDAIHQFVQFSKVEIAIRKSTHVSIIYRTRHKWVCLPWISFILSLSGCIFRPDCLVRRITWLFACLQLQFSVSKVTHAYTWVRVITRAQATLCMCADELKYFNIRYRNRITVYSLLTVVNESMQIK